MNAQNGNREEVQIRQIANHWNEAVRAMEINGQRATPSFRKVGGKWRISRDEQVSRAW